MLSSRGSSQPRDQTQISHNAGRFFNIWATREALCYYSRSYVATNTLTQSKVIWFGAFPIFQRLSSHLGPSGSWKFFPMLISYAYPYFHPCMQPMWGIPGSHSYCRFLRIARLQNTAGVTRTGCLSTVNLLPSHSQDQQCGVWHELVLFSLCSKMTQPRGKRPCLPDFQMPPSQCQYRVEQLLSASQIPENFYNYLQFIWDFLLEILVTIIINIYLFDCTRP